MRQLRMLDHLVDAPNLRRRRADRVKALLPGFNVFLDQFLLHDLTQGVGILTSRVPVDEAWIVEQIGAADLGSECAELALGVYRQQHKATLDPVNISRGLSADRLVAHLLLLNTAHSVFTNRGREESQRRVQHGYIDELSLAGAGALEERAGKCESAGHAPDGVADREAGAGWPGLHMTGDRHDARCRLNAPVIGRRVFLGPSWPKPEIAQ